MLFFFHPITDGSGEGMGRVWRGCAEGVETMGRGCEGVERVWGGGGGGEGVRTV